MPSLPVTEAEIDAFLVAFEGCTLPKAEWTHSAHLLTGACYVHGMQREAALAKMRECVRRYNESVGGKNTETSGYHETVTVMVDSPARWAEARIYTDGPGAVRRPGRGAVCTPPRHLPRVLRFRSCGLHRGKAAMGSTHPEAARLKRIGGAHTPLGALYNRRYGDCPYS